MFRYLITLTPLGLLYGSAGGFLSPDNLVGRSQAKFPPDSGTFAGLLLAATQQNQTAIEKRHLTVAGPFWTTDRLWDNPQRDFFVPLPRTKVVGKTPGEFDTWTFDRTTDTTQATTWRRQRKDLKSDYSWQTLSSWTDTAAKLNHQADTSVQTPPWQFVPMLHPRMQEGERCVEEEGGLFLEQAVRMNDDARLVYASTEPIFDGWYKFGGENHLVELECIAIDQTHQLNQLLAQPIGDSFAIITPAVWGSNRRSLRCPDDDFPYRASLTDKPVPYRSRSGGQEHPGQPGRLGRGRYAVKAGSVYVLSETRSDNWWQWERWFPREGFSLQRLGCGLALPLAV